MDKENDNLLETISDSVDNINNTEPVPKQEEMIDDIKMLLSTTIESTSDLFLDFIENIKTSINDQDIKRETHQIVSTMNEEFSNILDKTRIRIENNTNQSMSAPVGVEKEEE